MSNLHFRTEIPLKNIFKNVFQTRYNSNQHHNIAVNYNMKNLFQILKVWI